MDYVLIGKALLTVSLLTNLTVQAIKVVFDQKDKNYSTNVITAITSVVLSIALAALHVVMDGVPITTQYIAQVISLAYLSFLVATVGYDKVSQTFRQLQER